MLPAVVAQELREAVHGFLRSAFPVTTGFFQGCDGESADPQRLIDGLIAGRDALFKGPYLDLKLPFRRGSRESLPFRHVKLPFDPWQHQFKAFTRLVGDAPQSTIVATGTGSGKTECFMLPVLDDCLHRRERGIKTLVIYPMNALANDQAKRFAREVAKLDTRLTVGLYVGGGQAEATDAMGPNHVITNQKELIKNPPDILLTNYKMLDFLLIRPQDHPLWRYNKPGILRYLVVDELHTFDGAQGTDLACLIRRLRDRLQAGPELACVGTSATMGTGSKAALLRYASEVFATSFDADALVDEDRLSADEYLRGAVSRAGTDDGITYFNWPVGQLDDLAPQHYPSADDYLFYQARLWFDELPVVKLPALNAPDARQRAQAAVALGELLYRHAAFHELVRSTGKVTDAGALAERWQERLNLDTRHDAQALLSSLLSLVAGARLWGDKDSDDADDWTQPFLHMGVQLWLRELRRMVCSVHEGPKLAFADDLQNPMQPLHLPLLHCRECHLAGWGAVAKEGDSHLDGDLQHFYQVWFQRRPQARLLVPLREAEIEKGEAPELRGLCPHCLRVQPWRGQNCCECEHEDVLPVRVPDMMRAPSRDGPSRSQSHHNCPECGARDSLMVLGYRAATLTSVMVGRLFATPYNDDHKLIAFSDSVQDAAHRAGFLGANTWRQVVRQAMMVWLHKQSRPLSLADMAELLPQFWRQRVDHDGRFCGLFIPHNLTYRRDYERLRSDGRLPNGSDLPDLVSKRLSWECVEEFGRRSAIGRSLERTSQAAIAFDGARLAADTADAVQQLREEVEALRNVSDADFQKFLVGWLHHIRETGAIHHQFLDAYLARKGDEYQLNVLASWMPSFGRSKRPPSAITLQHVAANFEALVLAKRDTWATRWLKKTLAREEVMVAAEARQIFTCLLDALTRTGWLLERSASGEAVYQLEPARLKVVTDGCAAVCSDCHHPVRFGAVMEPAYADLPCLRGHCMGHLQATQPTVSSDDYRPADPHRLVPSEHTGLLERDAREAIETSFIHGRETWDINLLSATPTLEMGIDIGSLSSVFLCSVPPAQANYLQRIGRAGRRDGNALAVTVANGRNHDLYFYADPMQMISGAVHTPGVFLKARAVLERQLMAYCFDRWSATGVDASVLPGQLRKVLDAVEQQRTDRFPYNLIDFIVGNQADLLAGFFGLFEQLDDEARQYLRNLIEGTSSAGVYSSNSNSAGYRLVNRLQQLVDERKDLLVKVQKLKSERQRLHKLPSDEATKAEIEEIGRERGALLALLNSRNNQPVLNFFTDEGLLPNYAFPEEGVTLQSVILRRRSSEQVKDGESAYDKASYSFQRPAQAALGELAPESRFYAISHELPIDRVDLQLSRTEQWRFCDRCQHTERVDLDDRHSACSRCGSLQWGDSGQKHTVLRLRQVYSTVDDRKSRIGDDSEQRQPQFFNRQMLVDISSEAHGNGFQLKSETLPFGFEYLNRVVLREVNFGVAGGESTGFAVAGRELPRQGFHICKYCGTVQKARPRRNEVQHAYTCRLRQHPENEQPEDFFDSLYLYRELESEAIRILLPLSEVAYSDEKLHSFIAALNLGLREYFHGDVHHLEVTDMLEPASQGGSEKVYLVVYDRIPGGTGYLKELMGNPQEGHQQNLMRVLELARNRLVSCECVDEEDRDGCYRCILAYRDSRHMATISRRGATELLTEILALQDQLEPVDSLSNVTTNVLIESQLEQKFVDALARLRTAHVSHQLIHGKAGSLLTLKGEDGRPIAWQVEHQVKVGPKEHVALHTEIDVLLTPARAEDAVRYRPIAVYLDGLQYHHDRVADDVRKRTALLASKRYWVFSLNWDDLPVAGKLAKPCDPDLLRLNGLRQDALRDLYDAVAGQAPWLSAAACAKALQTGSMEQLHQLLRVPTCMRADAVQIAAFRTMTTLHPQGVQDPTLLEKLVGEMVNLATSRVLNDLDFDTGKTIPGGFMEALGNAPGGVTMTAGLPLTATAQNDAANILQSLCVHLCFDDRDAEPTQAFKAAWRAFWRAANQLQFLPGFSMATRRAVEDGTLAEVWDKAEQLAADENPAESAGETPKTVWSDVFDWAGLDASDIERLITLDLPEPEIGLDIAVPSGAIVIGGDVVELCWPDARVAVLNAPVSTEVASWRLIVAEGDWVEQIKLGQAEGWF